MIISKFDRKGLGLTVSQVAERSGLKIDRVKELEDAYLSLIGGKHRTESIDAQGDAAKYLAVLSNETKEQDKTVEAIIGRLLASGLNVSVTLVNVLPGSTTYQAEISKSKMHGKSLSSFGRGAVRLAAICDAIDSMRETVGLVAPLFPIADKDAA